jgi:hypothetical protein
MSKNDDLDERVRRLKAAGWEPVDTIAKWKREFTSPQFTATMEAAEMIVAREEERARDV